MDFAALQTAVSRDIFDPSHNTFSVTVVKDIINAALTEVGAIAPARFIEDITPDDDTLTYILQESVFGEAVPEIEVRRVELWDTTTTPDTFLSRLQPASGEFINSSNVGWENWNGVLRLTNAMEAVINPDVHTIKVWGYRPYVPLSDDSDASGLTNELEWLLRYIAKVEALERLNNSRDLFSQWQTKSGNSDMSPAGLQNALTQAQTEMRRRTNKARVLREVS